MSAANRGKKRVKDDAYNTPSWLVDLLFESLPELTHIDTILEPACGDGAVVDGLLRAGVEPYRIEVADLSILKTRRTARATGTKIVWQGDFRKLPVNGANRWGLIVTNPPYSIAEEFAMKAMQHAKVVALLLRVNFTGSRTRRAFWTKHPADMFVSERRPSFTGGGTDATEYAWFVWGLTEGGNWRIVYETKPRAKVLGAYVRAQLPPKKQRELACARLL